MRNLYLQLNKTTLIIVNINETVEENLSVLILQVLETYGKSLSGF